MSLTIITSIVAFVIAIGVLVSVHEFGHFWVARRLGFKVLRFSLGFGKPLLRRMSKDADPVEYVLAAIPLGGYVRLLDERDGPVPAGEEHRAFNRRPPLARIAVLLAGPGANFLFAIFAYWLLFMQGVPGLKPVIGEVAPESHAARADLRAARRDRRRRRCSDTDAPGRGARDPRARRRGWRGSARGAGRTAALPGVSRSACRKPSAGPSPSPASCSTVSGFLSGIRPSRSWSPN